MSAEPQPMVTVRPYANPLPLGFFCFGVGMALLGGLGTGLIDGDQVRTAGILLALFVFPLELLTAVMAFLARDTGAAGALGLFSTSWLALGVTHVVAPQARTSVAVGMYLAAFAIMLIPLAVVAFLGRVLLGLMLTTSALRAAVSAVYQLGGPEVFTVIDGALAFLLFALGLYAGTAFLIEDIRQRTVLPIARRGPARAAIEAEELAEQHARVPHEPGVRQQL